MRQAILETAQTLLRVAKAMTDTAIDDQLRAGSDDYQRRVEKASDIDAAKAGPVGRWRRTRRT
jgi:hypothetical protein